MLSGDGNRDFKFEKQLPSDGEAVARVTGATDSEYEVPPLIYQGGKVPSHVAPEADLSCAPFQKDEADRTRVAGRKLAAVKPWERPGSELAANGTARLACLAQRYLKLEGEDDILLDEALCFIGGWASLDTLGTLEGITAGSLDVVACIDWHL